MMHCARRRDRHVIAADPAAVRDLLIALEQGPALAGLTGEERECTLLVLAEALNNVVEHGYGGGPGWIGLMPGPRHSGRDWRILDRSQSVPPEECLQAEMPQDAAEGGFGWPLIRALTEEVGLRRCVGFNVLTLQVRAEGTQAPCAAGMERRG
jgi:serine/threonine-protein kinase RsbW